MVQKQDLGWALPKRIETIEMKVAEKPRPEKKHTIKFQNELQQFDVHVVQISMLKYRLANGRTIAAQEEYLTEHTEYNKDYFDDNYIEDLEVQEAQHEILSKMLISSNGNLKTFFKANKQEIPLIITREGLVVNGNRRLCAMRELLNENPSLYNHFNYVEVVILPHCTEEDIDRLEAELQIIKDIKADYGWVSEAKMIQKRHVKYDYSFEQLANLYDTTEKDIQYKLSLLDYVDSYLQHIGFPHEYKRIEKDEFAFKQIKKFREKIKVEEKRDIFQSLSFFVISAPKNDSDGRLYDYIPKISNNLDTIVDIIATEVDSVEEVETELSTFFDDSDEEVDLRNLGLALDNLDSEEKKKVVKTIKEVVDTQEEINNEEETNNYSFNKIKKANTFLTEAYFGMSEKSNTEGMEEQLKSVEEIINKIRKALL